MVFMVLFKGKYRVETTRLKYWDYASAGWYFVTVCTRSREHFFGEVVGAEARLSAVGEVAQRYWADIPTHFEHVRLDEYVVMPNHVHGIVVIAETRPVETRHGASLRMDRFNQFGPLKRGSLQAILNAYKGSVTRWCRENGHSYFAWQPRFYEHVIRDEKDLDGIRKYILDNPARWAMDRENKAALWM
jgi:REP element-mobilizing transposase RayT